MFFPHDSLRPSQDAFVGTVRDALAHGRHAIIHAPTGLGKTAASLAPAIEFALKNDMKVFFLTSRHTQHQIALKTVERLQEKSGKTIDCIDIIGKKWMCLHEGAQSLGSGDFFEFCRVLREDGKCDFLTNLKKGDKLQTKGKLMLESVGNPATSAAIISAGRDYDVCPYYASLELAKKATVIIGDYYYVFHPKVREQFFQSTGNELSRCVVIVDEAHNLGERIKHLASSRLTTIMLRRAQSECEKNKLDDDALKCHRLVRVLEGLGGGVEKLVTRSEFVSAVNLIEDYEALIVRFESYADVIRQKNRVSYVGSVAEFLRSWLGEDEGFARIVSRKDDVIMLSYRCLDPSLVSGPVFSEVAHAVLMSGTLTPTSMFREVLGVSSAVEEVFDSPFPKGNRLNLIIPRTSTKFTTRGAAQYEEIGRVVVSLVEAIPGNSAVFFPSYYLLGEVRKFIETATSRTVFVENSQMSSDEKNEFLDKFRSYKNVGAVLLGVISGNFGEGIDLPGDELKGVVIVGLPLAKPDVETSELIAYYDKRFGKGWDYGYLFPAFNKTLQSAGRCIRSETDRGVVVFLDERYAWPQYKRCFPLDWDMKITLLYEDMIKEFFKK